MLSLIRVKNAFLLLIIFFFFAAFASAQTPVVRYIGIDEGLSNNSVTSIYQDHNRFMWFGTYDGLNLYDGYSFKVFRNIIGDRNSLKSNDVNTIEGDTYNNIWVGCGTGASIYNPLKSSFSYARVVSQDKGPAQELSDNIHIIKAVGNGIVLVGTQHKGLYAFKNKLDPGKQIPLPNERELNWNFSVSAIDYDTTRKIAFVFIQRAGLFVYDAELNSLKFLSNQFDEANCLKVDKKGQLWLGNNDGVYLYNFQENTFTGNFLSKNSRVVSLWSDANNTLWLASDGGGVMFLREGDKSAVAFEVGHNSPLINSRAIYAIFADHEDRKWVGTLRGGINVIDPRPVAFKKIVYNRFGNNILADNFINAFYEDKDGIWIGTSGAGLRFWNRASNTYKEYVHKPEDKTSVSSNFITSIISDYKGNLWLSTWFGGISRFNKSTGTFERYTCINPNNGLAQNNAWLLYEDSKKKLWASTTNDGTLFLFNREKNRFEIFDDRIINVQCLAEDRQGNLWGGNYSSIIKIEPVTKKHIYFNFGYPIRFICPESGDDFWVGTQGGGLLLFNKENGGYKQYTTSNGLPSNIVLRILKDQNNNLWLSTYNGLSRFDVSKKSARNFFQSDGLQSNQFSFNASLALKSGEFLFGGIKGFNVFYPDSIYDANEKLGIFLSDVEIDDSPVGENQRYVTERSSEQIREITIPFDKAVVSLNYLALDYSGSEKINYAYYLKGWDKSWNYVNKIRTVNYSHLEEGNYTFKVKASKQNNYWGQEVELLRIIVLPPWYRTWWAYSLYLLIFAGLIYLYLLYKGRQSKLEYEVKVAHLEAEKEKELNEKKLSFFTNISHEFRTPLSLIINPIKDILNKNGRDSNNHDLNTVYHNAKRLLRLVDQLLLFKRADSELGKLNLVTIDLYELCKEVYSCFIQQARTKKISYELEFENKELQIFADREKIEIALFNLLSNAFKYTSEGGKISFAVKEHAAEVLIEVRDSGIGIPPETGDLLFQRFYQVKDSSSSATGFGIGLYLVKNFIEAHLGRISYESKVGEGTSFFVALRKGDVTKAERHSNSSVTKSSGLLAELNEELDVNKVQVAQQKISTLDARLSDRKTILIIDDDAEIANYLLSIFSSEYNTIKASNGKDGIRLAHEHLPDIILSDLVMTGVGGIELIKTLKEDSTVSHIPVVLLTGSSSEEFELKGIESGAEDFIKKPFDKDILTAKVAAILKSRNTLQKYFYNEITLQTNNLKVSPEYKEFLDKCIRIVESHLEDETFSIKTLASEIGMSHSTLYKKVKSISGQSVNSFIRFIRLRKAAEILIETDNNVNQTASMVGFSDVKYFREQFNKLFGMNPSEYIKKYRSAFHNLK